MTDAQTTRIIERVQKLLNLANDAGAAEGERDNALRMAHATLAKYNLDLAQVEAHGRQKEDRGMTRSDFPNHIWARQVCHCIAQLFFCHYICTRGGNEDKGAHFFVGRQANATTAALVSEFAVRSIVKEGQRKMRERGERWSWFRAFGTGAAIHIAERVTALMQDRNQVEGSDSKALVLASLYQTEAHANDEWMKRMNLQTQTTTYKPHVEAEASREGYVYGATVPLQASIQNKA